MAEGVEAAPTAMVDDFMLGLLRPMSVDNGLYEPNTDIYSETLTNYRLKKNKNGRAINLVLCKSFERTKKWFMAFFLYFMAYAA